MPTPPPTHPEIPGTLRDSLKEAIFVFYELENGHIDEHLLSDRGQRDRLLLQPEIRDLLDAYINAELPQLRERHGESRYELLLRFELDELLQEISAEVEGLGTTDDG